MEKTVLSAETANKIKNNLAEFFKKHGATVQERTYKNCTLSKVIRGSSIDGHLHESTEIVVDNVNAIIDEDIAVVTITAVNTPSPAYYFKPGTTFAIGSERVYVKVPCTDFGKENKFRYVIKVFES